MRIMRLCQEMSVRPFVGEGILDCYDCRGKGFLQQPLVFVTY